MSERCPQCAGMDYAHNLGEPCAYDAMFDDERDDCWNCGGEGYIADCFDGFCVNAEDGCELCLRRCEYCNEPKANAALSNEQGA